MSFSFPVTLPITSFADLQRERDQFDLAVAAHKNMDADSNALINAMNGQFDEMFRLLTK